VQQRVHQLAHYPAHQPAHQQVLQGLPEIYIARQGSKLLRAQAQAQAQGKMRNPPQIMDQTKQIPLSLENQHESIRG
jgi:hypothetical protein